MSWNSTLSPGGRLRRHKPMRRVSKQRRKQAPERREVVAEVMADAGHACWARTPVCTGYAVHGHEVLPRGRGGSIVQAANVKPVCFECHAWIGNNTAEAERLGLLRSRTAEEHAAATGRATP